MLTKEEKTKLIGMVDDLMGDISQRTDDPELIDDMEEDFKIIETLLNNI